MATQIGVLVGTQQHLLFAEDAQELEQAARRLSGAVEQTHRGLVGGGLLGAGVAQRTLERDVVAAGDDRLTEVGPAGGDRRGEAENVGGDQALGRPAEVRTAGRRMACRQMAGFMSDHTDHLKRVLGAHQQAGMDEHVEPRYHEGVKRRIVDQVDVDRPGAQTGRLE